MKANNFHVLVDSSEFMEDLEERILEAKDRVLIQAMTFEADTAGMRLFDAMKVSKAKEKILCLDAYSLANINDGWAYGWRYLTNSDHRKEVNETRRILKTKEKFGIQAVVTNPLGILGIRYPYRNHKKVMTVDDVTYIGGINFSEHNFAWHDFMVKISDQEVVEAIVEDFRLTCSKKNQSFIYTANSTRLFFLDGNNSGKEYVELFGEILKAQKSVTVMSPYVSDPLLSKLLDLDEHVEVNIVTPRHNNKSLMKNGLYDRLRDKKVNLYEYGGGMSHLKSILIDDSKLIFGSSNFDVVSYYLEQEVVVVSENADLIEDFKKIILEVDLEKSQKIDLATIKKNFRARVIMFLLKNIVAFLGVFRFRKT
ncbi:MAG: phosphatidylserine/phosphatidylglycerophosphate/cardiolipin synthase family protein [Cytophagales bacterium]|nr:phosphatidylserine/phosphatidylglycerophosphate/cardiolipin synthase family protein [Cytophagales bacterium]